MADLRLIVKVVTEGTNNLRNLGSDLSTTGKNLTIGLTTPLLAAGGAVTALAADAQKSQAKLKSVFESTGASAFTSIDALNQHAEALAKATTFDDDAVADAQARLLTFGNVTGEAFTGATEAAADLAAFFETDMDTAAQTIGRALESPIDGLARLGRQGIIFSDEQKEAIAAMQESGDLAGAQAAVLDVLHEKFGTVAEDLANTDAGAFTQAMNELGEAGEALGVFLLPALRGLADVLKTLAGFFTNMPPQMQGLVVAFAGIVAAVGPVLFIGGKVIGMFQAVGAAFRILSTLLLTNPFVALAAAIIALVALVVLNWDKIVAVFKGALKFIGDVGEKLWTPISEGFGAAIDFIRGIWNAFARWWNSIEVSVPSIDIPFVGKVGGFTIGLPDLPFLAEGGIVNQPTLALIGESGPEAVIPLGRLQSGSNGNVFNFYPATTTFEEEDVVEAVERSQRLTGMLAWD